MRFYLLAPYVLQRVDECSRKWFTADGGWGEAFTSEPLAARPARHDKTTTQWMAAASPAGSSAGVATQLLDRQRLPWLLMLSSLAVALQLPLDDPALAQGHLLADDDRRRFLNVLDDVVSRYGWICHAYCLMSNHYRLPGRRFSSTDRSQRTEQPMRGDSPGSGAFVEHMSPPLFDAPMDPEILRRERDAARPSLESCSRTPPTRQHVTIGSTRLFDVISRS